METETTKKEYTLDASGKKLGRIASDIAVLLQGKNEADYSPNKAGDVIVTVENIGKLSISEAKKDTKKYQNYSGYPGGLKEKNLRRLITDKGVSESLRRAVKGMLPKNKLQSVRMKNLIIKEE